MISEEYPEFILDKVNSRLLNVILNKNGDYISI
jgi:hypothetical protein